MDIRKLRMGSLFPTSQAKRAPNLSGNNILDQFINQIMPMIQNQGPSAMDLHQEGLMKKQQQREDRIRGDQEFLSRPPTGLPQISRAMREPPEKPMNVVLGNQISPYQEATLGMRARELESREGLNKQKQTESQRKNLATEEDRSRRTAVLEAKLANDDLTESEAAELQYIRGMEKQRQGQRFTERRDATQQGNALTRIDRGAEHTMEQIGERGKLEKEYIALRNDNSKAAVERKAVIDAALAANKPESASQEKTGMQVKYNKLINQHPEWRDFMEINEDGIVEVLPIGMEQFGPDRYGPTEEVRKKILESLGMSESAPSSAVPPVNAAPPAPATEETVDMIAPDGRPLKVPKSKVAELESKGAKRK